MFSNTPKDADFAKQYLEEQKTVLDYVKHITTLGTGSIVLLATLLDKIFTAPEWTILVQFTFASFVLSIIFLTLAAFGIIRSIRTPANVSAGLADFTAWSFILGLAGFLGGILLLAVFAVRNWA